MGRRIPGIFTGRSQENSMERDHMEWSDDEIIRTIMDTKVGVDRIESNMKEVKKCTDDHENRIRVLEQQPKGSFSTEEKDRNWKTVTKKYGTIGGVIVLIGYILWDIYMMIRTGAG